MKPIYRSKADLKHIFSITMSVCRSAIRSIDHNVPTMRLDVASSRAVRIIRAHFSVVALGCLTLQLPVLGLIFIFRVSESAFRTTSFRGFVLIYVVCFVVAFRLLAWFAHAQIAIDDLSAIGNQSTTFWHGIARSQVVRWLSRVHVSFLE
jgi:hypothetical protein